MAPMKLLSVNVGLPREIEFHGKLVRTSIFKSPASGQVRVATLNLEGDEQSDLSAHGGVHKAVYGPGLIFGGVRGELHHGGLA